MSEMKQPAREGGLFFVLSEKTIKINAKTYLQTIKTMVKWKQEV